MGRPGGSWLLALALLGLLWAGAAPCPAAEGGLPEAIVLGVPTSLKTVEGKESLEAVRLAVEEINAAGGVDLGGRRLPMTVATAELADSDPATTPTQAVAKLTAFMDRARPHALVVGPFRSEVLLAAMDLIAARRVPLLGAIAMSPVSEALVMRDRRYRYYFRLCLNARYLVDYMIGGLRLLNQRLGTTRVYILNQDVAWARGTASFLIKLFFDRSGWQVLGQRNFTGKETDFRPTLREASRRGAQVLLCIFDAPGSGRLVRQWRELGMEAPLYGFISPIVGPGAWKAYGGQVAGTFNVIFELGNIPSRRHPPAQAFWEAFRRHYGRPIQAGHGPAPAYESVYVLKEAMERVGSLEPDALVAALEATDRMGAMGRIRFHQGHQAFYGNDPQEEALGAVIQWTAQGHRAIVYPQAVAEAPVAWPPEGP